MNRLFISFLLSMAFVSAFSQPKQGGDTQPKPQTGGISLPASLDDMIRKDEFIVEINPMTTEKRRYLDRMASLYRENSRSVLTTLGKSMMIGGVTSAVTVLATELVKLTKVRKNQKQKWMEMRNKECVFIDSLCSVNGQRDFYRLPSSYGPLDPSDMNFDGITFRASRGGKDVLRMVCHLDTTRLAHLFLHSKFYLVLDTLEFHPYQSFLPNLSANRVMGPDAKASDEEKAYWNTISQFDFAEQKDPKLKIRLDFSSSWINEAVQIHRDVFLGSFDIEIPVKENNMTGSVYFYSRQQALAEGKPTIDVNGDCFVVPRSYMPVSAQNPSWGTGEYKMKVVMSETCRYNPDGKRAKNWHDDYKQLVRMQNNGKAGNEYWAIIKSAIMDNSSTILKSTYTPLVSYGMNALGLQNATAGAAGKTGGAMPGAAAGGNMPAGAGTPGAAGGAPGQGGMAPQQGAPGGMPK